MRDEDRRPLSSSWQPPSFADQFDREEERAARADAGWPDDDGRPDPSEYMDPPDTDDPMTFDGPTAPDFLHISKTLDCGHRVEAHEESGGFDEVPRVTEAMVRGLLAFKVKTHDCDLTEEHMRRQRDVVGWGPAEGPPSDVPGMGPIQDAPF